MRTESVYMMLAIGLALGDQVNRIVSNGAYRAKAPGRNGRINRLLRSGAAYEAGLYDDYGNYLEKFATQYEIIPLMSKLI